MITCDEPGHSQSSLSLIECQNKAESVGAKYIYWQSPDERAAGQWCHVYSSCDSTKTPSISGTNYELKAARKIK